MWRQFYFKDNLKDKNVSSYSCFSVNYECKFCPELLNIFKLWHGFKFCLCSKTRPRCEFVICAKMENLELFRKWYPGF